jgi:putative membrane protein
MRLGLSIAAILGLALAVALVGFYGFAEIGAALLGIGWGALALISFHLVQILFSSLAWQRLLPRPLTPRLLPLAGVRAIREAVNNLLPVAQIGGEFVAARLLRLASVPLGLGGASVTVDLTMEMVSQILFTLLGLALLMAGVHDARLVQWAMVGIGAATVIAILFVSVQRVGLFRLLERGLVRVAEKAGWSSLGEIAGLHESIQMLYRDPRRLGLAAFYHLVSWLLGGVEVMLALRLVGVSVDLRDGLIIESLGQALRAVGFAVPGSLGVQEGGFVLVCGLVGVSPQAAIELSLLKRLRELALGVPALIAWQFIEGRGLVDRLGGAARRPAIAEGD